MAFVIRIDFTKEGHSTIILPSSEKTFQPRTTPMTKMEWQHRYNSLPYWLKTDVNPDNDFFDFTTGLRKPSTIFFRPDDLKAPFSWPEMVALDLHEEKIADEEKYGCFGDEYEHPGHELCPKCQIFGTATTPRRFSPSQEEPSELDRLPPHMASSIRKVTHYLLDPANIFETEDHFQDLPVNCQICFEMNRKFDCCLKSMKNISKELQNNGEILYQDIDGAWMTWNPFDGHKSTDHYDNLHNAQGAQPMTPIQRQLSLVDVLYFGRQENMLSIMIECMSMNK